MEIQTKYWQWSCQDTQLECVLLKLSWTAFVLFERHCCTQWDPFIFWEPLDEGTICYHLQSVLFCSIQWRHWSTLPDSISRWWKEHQSCKTLVKSCWKIASFCSLVVCYPRFHIKFMSKTVICNNQRFKLKATFENQTASFCSINYGKLPEECLLLVACFRGADRKV